MNHKQLHREYFCKNCSRFIFVQVLIDLCQILLRVCKFYKQVFTALGFNDNNGFVEYKTCFILIPGRQLSSKTQQSLPSSFREINFYTFSNRDWYCWRDCTMSISANFTTWCDRFALKGLRNAAECVLLVWDWLWCWEL